LETVRPSCVFIFRNVTRIIHVVSEDKVGKDDDDDDDDEVLAVDDVDDSIPDADNDDECSRGLGSSDV
jgi:hypothetical protein